MQLESLKDVEKRKKKNAKLRRTKNMEGQI
jgi:hypothetical protein